MGINPLDLRKLVIRPTLEKLGKWTLPLENLLLGTAAQATQLGFHLQYDDGIGIFRISPQRHKQVWDCYFAFDPDLASLARGFASQREFLNDPDFELATNLRYATVIAWGVYALHNAIIPIRADDTEALAACWHRFYCTDVSEKQDHFVENYRLVHAAEQNCIAA